MTEYEKYLRELSLTDLFNVKKLLEYNGLNLEKEDNDAVRGHWQNINAEISRRQFETTNLLEQLYTLEN